MKKQALLKNVFFTLLFLVTNMLHAEDIKPPEGEFQKVTIAEAYIELHTGPGSGYPIFYVEERGKFIQILKRKTDWFKVYVESGKIGWVNREQLEKTLTQAGVGKTFKDIVFDDYIASKLEFGISGGLFESEQSYGLRIGYKLIPNLSFELVYTKIAGRFSSSTLYQGNFVLQLYPESRFSPFLLIGYGSFQNAPSSSLVAGKTVNLDMGNAGIGVKYYLTDQFYFRLDASTYVVLVGDNRTDEYTHISGGFSFFF